MPSATVSIESSTARLRAQKSLQLLHDSLTTANVKMLLECRKSHDNYQYVYQVGFLQHAWEIAARQHLTCGSYQSACSTGERSRAHSSGETTRPFITGMEHPLAESPTREGKRTAVSRRYGTPQVDLRHMLEGDVPQD